MRRVAIFILIMMGWACPAMAGKNTWTSNGPVGPDGVKALAIDSQNPMTLYAGNPAGVFKSTDGGSTWTQMVNGLENTLILSLAVNPQDSNKVLAGTDGGGVYRSNDGGATWLRAENGFTRIVRDLAIDPRNPDTVYAAIHSLQIIKSVNGGAFWALANAGLPQTSVNLVLVNPQNSGTIYAGNSQDIFKSTDGGDSWNPTGSGPVLAMAIDPVSPDTLYAAGLPQTNNQLLVTTNGGGVWTPVAGLSENVFPRAIAIDPDDPDVLYLSHDTSVLKSGDGGFQEVGEMLPGGGVASLTIDPLNTDILYATTSFSPGILKTTNGGSSWNPSAAGVEVAKFALAVTIDPSNPNVLYAGANNSGVFKSTDGGQTWAQANSGIANQSINSVTVDPQDPDTVFASAGDTVFKSPDGGESWTDVGMDWPTSVLRVNFPEQPFQKKALFMTKLAIDPDTPNTLYGIGNPIFKTTDGGDKWTFLAVDANRQTGCCDVDPLPALEEIREDELCCTREDYQALAIDPHHSDTLYVGGGLGLQKSSDGGSTWVDLPCAPDFGEYCNFFPSNITAIAIDPVTPDKIYVAGDGAAPQLGMSTDGGETWNFSANGLSRALRPFSLVIDPSNPSNLWLGSFNRGVHRSRSGGAGWRPSEERFRNGLDVGSWPAQFIHDMAIHPDGRKLFVAIRGGVFEFSVEPFDAFFAQFANGGTLTSDTVLTNPLDDAPISGTIRFFDNDGNPLSVGILDSDQAPVSLVQGGRLTVGESTSSVGFEIGPLDQLTISTDGLGQAMPGSAVVESQDELGGIIRFNIPGVGVAGVGLSPLLNGFIVPVERQVGGINTGVAIFNSSESAATIDLALRTGGEEVATAERELQSSGHLAEFIGEIFSEFDTSVFSRER